MSVTFQVEGEDDEKWSLNVNEANAATVADMLGIQLSGPQGKVGELAPDQCVECMTRIELLLHSDLTQYVRPYSDTQQPRGIAAEIGNIVKLDYGPRIISPGTTAEAWERRLATLYTLFQRALELNKRIVWS